MFIDLLPQLFEGAIITVEVFITAAFIAIIVGFAAGLARLSKKWFLRAIAVCYIEVFRGTSALVQLFWIFFVLPLFGINLSAFQAGSIALGLNVGAYGAEVVRGAILSVPKGQFDAAVALNMPYWHTMISVILPQAIVPMLPPWGTILIEGLKNTALVSLITLSDLTFKAYQLNQTTFRTIEIFILVLLIYFALSGVVTFIIRFLERQLGRNLIYKGSF
jgi:polar amino acid transport system permease protein